MNTEHIRKRMLLRAPLARVWRALADSTEFGTWFGMKIDGQFAPGRRLHATIAPTTVDPEVGEAQKSHEGTPFEIAVERMDTERLFSFRWHPDAVEPGKDYSQEPTTLVEFALEQVEGGVLLTVTESGFEAIPLERRAKALADNERGWEMMVKVIGKYVSHA